MNQAEIAEAVYNAAFEKNLFADLPKELATELAALRDALPFAQYSELCSQITEAFWKAQREGFLLGWTLARQ